jgi:hypothetical protein
MNKHHRKAEAAPRPAPAVAPARAPAADARQGGRPHGGVTLEEATRVRAYQLWDRAGRPEGDGVAFWLEAEAELKAGQ